MKLKPWPKWSTNDGQKKDWIMAGNLEKLRITPINTSMPGSMAGTAGR